MAEVAESVQNIVPGGLQESLTGSLSAANTYQSPNDGRVFLHIVNGGGSPDTVTIVTNAQVHGLAIADRTVSVPAGEERMIGPFPPEIYNNSDGELEWSHSFITSVTQSALRL